MLKKSKDKDCFENVKKLMYKHQRSLKYDVSSINHCI